MIRRPFDPRLIEILNVTFFCDQTLVLHDVTLDMPENYVTCKSEDLMLELKMEFTIVIVTHSLPKAARISPLGPLTRRIVSFQHALEPEQSQTMAQVLRSHPCLFSVDV